MPIESPPTWDETEEVPTWDDSKPVQESPAINAVDILAGPQPQNVPRGTMPVLPPTGGLMRAEEAVARAAEGIVGGIANLPNLPFQVLGRLFPGQKPTPEMVGEAYNRINEILHPAGVPPSAPTPVEQGAAEFAKKFIAGAAAPENLALMTAAPAAPGVVGRLFQTQMISQTPEAIQALTAAKTPAERTEAALNLATGVAIPSVIEAGIARARPAAPPIPDIPGRALRMPEGARPPTATQTTPPVPAAEMPTTPTETGIRPAIRLVGGDVVVGDAGQTHPDIIKSNSLKAEDIDQRGFVDTSGKFLDREQAAAATPQVPTEAEAQRRHSTDLPEAKETPPVPSTQGAPAEAAAQPKPVSPAAEPSAHDLIKSGDTIRWEPNEKASRYQSAVEGIVQDVIHNSEGEIGYHIFSPTKDDPTNVVRVWANRGKIVSRTPAAVEAMAPRRIGGSTPTTPSETVRKETSTGRTADRLKTVVEIADEIAAQGVDPQASYGQFVKARDLKPEISAKEWLPIYRRSLELAKLNKQIEITKKAKAEPPPPVSKSATVEPTETKPSRFSVKSEGGKVFIADAERGYVQIGNSVKDTKANRTKLQSIVDDLHSGKRSVPEVPTAIGPGATPPPAKPEATVAPAVAKVQGEVQRVAKTEGQRPAKDIKEEYVQRVEDEINSLIKENDASGEKTIQKSEASPDSRGGARWSYGSVYADVEKTNGGYRIKTSETSALRSSNTSKVYLSGTFKTLEECEWFLKAVGSTGKGTLTVDIPGDGITNIHRHGPSLIDVWQGARKLETSSQGKVSNIPSGGGGKVDADEIAASARKLYGDNKKAIAGIERQLASEQEMEPGQRYLLERAAQLLREDTVEFKRSKRIDELKESIAEDEQNIKAATERVAKTKAEMKSASGTSKQRNFIYQQENLIKNVTAALPGKKAEYDRLLEAHQAEHPPAPEGPAGAGPGTPVGPGMGGAIPSEFGSAESFASNMFAVIDKDRAEMGKPPMDPTVRRGWNEDNQRALAQMNRDPNWIPDLIREVLKRPRPLMSWENAGVVWQRAKWKAEYNGALQRVARAFDDNRAEDLAAAKTDAAVFEDKLEELDRAVGRNGTGSEAGRTLNAQKMGAGDDFTLIEMVLRKRAALGGRKLTPEETAALQKDVERLNALNDALVKDLATRDQRLAEAESARAIAELKAKSVPTFDRRVLAYAENIVKKWETEAGSAAARLKEKLKPKLGIVPEPLDPTIISDIALWGRGKISRLALDAAKFADEAIREFGENIRPYLDEAWKASNALIDKGVEKLSEPVKRAIKKTDLASIKEATAANVKDKVEKKQFDKITWQVQNLAREFVKSGISEREPLIDAVHEVLKDVIPGQTRRQTMDMISGYGDYRQLSKDQITVQLRGMKGEMQQIAKLEDMAAGKPPLKSGLERRTPTDEERQLIKLVNDAKNKFQVPVSDPETQLKSSLDTLKTTLKNRIADYEDRLARKDYAPRPRREVQLDVTANRLKAEAERIKKRFREALIADRLKNRTKWEKFMDWGSKFRRAGVLTSPVVFPKLISAGAQRLASMPLEEGAGAVWRHIPGVSSVAAKAPLEGGGMNLRAEMRGYGAAFTKGLQDAYTVLKKGHSDLDVLYGKASESYTGEFEYMSRFLSLPGRLHGMIKAPVKRATFERAVQRLGEYYAKQGLDPANEVVQTRIAVEAYKAANRSIFLQDNRVASAFTAALRSLEAPGKETGKPTVGGKVLATTGRVLLPIVRVPTNIVAETMQYAGGLISGSARLGVALAKGTENLAPEQADLIMRELKKGSIGGAVLLMGYFNADSIGGFYQPNRKKKEGDIKWGAIRVNGVDVPSYLMHNPLLETLQFGATIRHVADSKLRKKDTEVQGIGAGTFAAAVGLMEEVPFVREMSELDKLMNPYTRSTFLGEQAKSIAVPAAVQRVAEWTDPEQKRYPRTVMEHIKSGVPGFREQVPSKKQSRNVPSLPTL